MKNIIIVSLMTITRLSHSYTLTKATCGVEIYNPTTTGCCDGVQYDFLTHYCCANNDGTNSMSLTIVPCTTPSSGIAQYLSSPSANVPRGTTLIIRSVDESVAESGIISVAELSETDDVAHDIDEFFGLTDDENDDGTDDDGEDDDDDDVDSDGFATTESSSDDMDTTDSSDDMDTTDATGSGSGSGSDSVDDSVESDDSDSNEDDDDEFGSEFNNDGTLSDRSGAVLGGANGENNLYDADGAASDSLDYYVKITLINMWLILGLIVIINIVFYWCYCRRQHRQNKRRQSAEDAMFDADDNEGPIVVVNQHLSEEEQHMIKN